MTESTESDGSLPDLAPESEPVLIAWNARVRVLTNPSVWFGVSMSFGAGALVIGLIFLFSGEILMGLLISSGIFFGFMVLFVLIGAVIDIFGGFHVTFALTNGGVRSIAGSGAKAVANAAIVTGILTGNLTGIGAGKLAQSEQNVLIPWGEISRVKVREWRRSILIKGTWAQTPIDLTCNADNFPQVLQILTERCPSIMS